jgi:hypothetical protein
VKVEKALALGSHPSAVYRVGGASPEAVVNVVLEE